MPENLVSVLSTIPIPDPWLERLRRNAPRCQFSVVPANKPEEVPPETWQNTDVLFTYRVLPPSENVPRLKWVQVYRSSMEHLLENPLLKSETVKFTTMSGAHAPQVGEFILTSILALGHQV
ncbi:MAG: hypothetical protein AAGU05_02105, partial [Anaerolineaceae bacterium]